MSGLSIEANEVLAYLVNNHEPYIPVTYDMIEPAVGFDEPGLDDALHALQGAGLIKSAETFGSRLNTIQVLPRAWEVIDWPEVGYDVEADKYTVATKVNQAGKIDGPTLEKLTELPTKRINIAVLLLQDAGQLELDQGVGTHPYQFATAKPNYKTRQYLSQFA